MRFNLKKLALLPGWIEEVEETRDIRASASCRADIAKAAGKYVSAHKKQFNPLKVIALDRALATACT